MQVFKIYKEELISLSTEPYYSQGILPSEAFAFISMCKAFNIDMIIDSGTSNGQACFLFAKYLNISVHTIDDKIQHNNDEHIVAKSRCKQLDVTFHTGDSLNVLPKLIKEYSDKKIAVFINESDGSTAQRLREDIWKYDNVLIAGCHGISSKNRFGCFSSITHTNFVDTYQSIFDIESLNHVCPDDNRITLRQRFERGMGIDIWYKSRNIVYYVYTGGAEELYNDFIQSVKRQCNATLMCLTNEETDVIVDYKTVFTEEERGGIMGPKLNALRRLPLVDGDRVFIMDIDTYLNNNVFDVFDKYNITVGVTSRNKKHGTAAEYSPINAGVWCYTQSENIEMLFTWFYEQLVQPTYDKWISYKKNHPFSTSIGLKEWWVDQDLINILFINQNEFNITVTDIGPEYNWVVTDDEFLAYKDKQYSVLHRKSGTRNRWK
jgi:hypothetical protein